MALVEYTHGTSALRAYFRALLQDVNDTIVEGGHVATGETIRSNTISVVDRGAIGGIGILFGPGHWESVGSGSPPGTRAEIPALERWVMAKGLANNSRAALRFAYLTSRKIYREGSKDWREGNENSYIRAIRLSRGLPEVERAYLKDLDGAVASQFTNLKRAA